LIGQPTDQVLHELGYDVSPNYVPIESLFADPDHGFLYRKAQEKCHAKGVYLLRGRTQQVPQTDVPVVYVCAVDSEQSARRVHQLVWNQDLVPFLIVSSPKKIYLYPGFRYRYGPDSQPDHGSLRVLTDFNRIANDLDAFSAEAIDSGKTWHDMASEVRAEEGWIGGFLEIYVPLRRNYSDSDSFRYWQVCLSPVSERPEDSLGSETRSVGIRRVVNVGPRSRPGRVF